MDLLANYDDENTGDNSMSESPKTKEANSKTNLAPNVLENEWLSFEQMIAPGGGGNTDPVKSSDFLVNGIVAYPGMKGSQKSAESGLALEEQSSASSDSDEEEDKAGQSKDLLSEEPNEGVPVKDLLSEEPNEGVPVKKDDEDDDAFFKLRKQVKERDRSSSSDRSGSSGSSSPSSSRSCSPSPPHLSPVNSIKSHTSDPPDLTERDADDKAMPAKTDGQSNDKKEDGKLAEEKKRPRSKDRKRSRSRDRKRSHRSKHEHSSKSKHRRSRSRSKDRKRRRSHERRRHKDKKSRDRKSSRDEKRSKSRERKDSKSENQKSEGRDRKDSTSEKIISDTQSTADIKSDVKDSKDSKSDGHRKRSRSRDRKDKKKDRRRSRSRHRQRSRSRDRRSRDRKRSRSKERKRSRSKDRKRKHRSRSRDRRSRSRHRSRDRHSRSRSRERLRSRSPVLGRKLTFKEQMRKEFINASKEMSNQEHKVVSDLDALRKPGEALRPSDLLKGVKLNSGESVTPQMALIQTMAAMHKKAQELTGVEVPKYYNPAAVNPIKYAEQVQKRKLLWSKKTDEKDKNDQMETQWKSAFVATEDNRTASKFRKLMGMKEGEGQSSAEELPEDLQKLSEEQQRKQAELFQRLDQDYQFARMTTHTQRGVGLGFSTTIIDPNHPQNPP